YTSYSCNPDDHMDGLGLDCFYFVLHCEGADCEDYACPGTLSRRQVRS
ncbi:hypothetical protein JI435_149550, partial [Parastagonospora nodorum SN15]